MKLIFAALTASAMVVFPVLAYEIQMIPEEAAICAEEHGCGLITGTNLQRMLDSAFEAGVLRARATKCNT